MKIAVREERYQARSTAWRADYSSNYSDEHEELMPPESRACRFCLLFLHDICVTIFYRRKPTKLISCIMPLLRILPLISRHQGMPKYTLRRGGDDIEIGSFRIRYLHGEATVTDVTRESSTAPLKSPLKHVAVAS